MTKLSVNVNKLATLRNSRGKNNPDVAALALKIISYGAQGITVHPRPDERHIRRSDVVALALLVREQKVEFNIEGYPSESYLQLIEQVHPDQATLVPDPPEALTSNAGWKLGPNKKFLGQVCERLKRAGARVSVFMDPRDFSPKTGAEASAQTVKDLTEIGADRIELYTEEYAEAFPTAQRESVTESYQRLAQAAHGAGLGINAGHDLDRANLRHLIEKIPFIDEVSIGHALICDALELGLEKTVRAYLDCLK
jgi:pyridoxine 5-phosphate synthase